MTMWQQIRSAVLLFIVVTSLTGIVYPFVVTGLAQILFPRQANGSLIKISGNKKASELIGQPFSDPGYFWGRPSATTPTAYNGASSAGSNLGPSNH
jgi:K+-transporting ATPase ATPase C chain